MFGVLALVMTAANPVVHVAFDLTPFVEDTGAPTLRVTVYNRSPKPVPFVTFEQDACFAHFYLSLAVSRGSTPEAPTACAVLSFPGVKTTMEPNGQFVRTLSFAKLYPGAKWPAASYPVKVEWNPSRLAAALGARFGVQAEQTSHNASAVVVVHAQSQFDVKRGETVTLPDGARFSFEGHSHKMTKGDSESPLMVSGRVTAPKATEAEAFTAYVFARQTRFFTVGPHLLFRLDDSVYGESMKLTYFGPVTEP